LQVSRGEEKSIPRIGFDAYKNRVAKLQQNKMIKLSREVGQVVGTVHTLGGLKMVGCPPPGVDVLEARLDALPAASWPGLLRAAVRPVILTPRARGEGGARDWSVAERARMVQDLLPDLPQVAAVDLELAQVGEFSTLCKKLRKIHVALICSAHDFSGTPSARTLLRWRDRAVEEGADFFKVAVWLRTPQDLKPLLDLLAGPQLIPTSVMGMGPWGTASRIYLARAGSVLNYGWLHRPQVPGQLPAARLARLLREVGEPPKN
jgi:3-dehydroquinate dehydratase-1